MQIKAAKQLRVALISVWHTTPKRWPCFIITDMWKLILNRKNSALIQTQNSQVSGHRSTKIFIRKLVRLYCHVAKHDIVYIDATGSILLDDKHCYAYEIVICHPHRGKPRLAVATYFATSHNIPSASYFIRSFCHAESILYESNRTIPKLVMCDGILALIQSIVLSLFKETLQVCLNRCFTIASGKFKSSISGLPFLHMFASHFI